MFLKSKHALENLWMSQMMKDSRHFILQLIKAMYKLLNSLRNFKLIKHSLRKMDSVLAM